MNIIECEKNDATNDCPFVIIEDKGYQNIDIVSNDFKRIESIPINS